MKLQEQIHRIQEIIKNDKNLDNSEYDLHKSDSYWITIPKKKPLDDALFVYSGQFGGTGGEGFIYSQVPESIKNNRIVIYAQYDSPFDQIIQSINENPDIITKNFKVKSVCGYSGGGPNTLKELGKGFNIGLMDPYINKEGLKNLENNLSGSNIRLVYSLERWDEYKNKEDNGHNPYYNLIEANKLLKGRAEFLDGMDHGSFPKYFFNKYSKFI